MDNKKNNWHHPLQKQNKTKNSKPTKYLNIFSSDELENYLNRWKLHFFPPHLQDVDKWSFDVFALNEASGEHSLKFMMYELFTRYDLLSRFKVRNYLLIKIRIQK